MILSLIVAMDRGRVIGKNNRLPWHLPGDLKRFKAATMGKPIVMGRRTWESLGRALPGRHNIVITRDRDYIADGAEVAHSLDEALASTASDDEVFVIGGEQIYKQALPLARRLYLTLVDAEFAGDAWFPDYADSDWQELGSEDLPADDVNPYSARFVLLERQL